MAISDELFMAILAMDAYNRGYGSVFTLEGNAIGNATYRGDTLPEGSQDVSFFASTYDWGTQKVIAYRGTDALVDPLSGWPVACGEYWGPQAIMAARVYQDLCQSSNVAANDILLTGHSLGGGLAGLIGGIYGSSATIFDNMPYYNSLSSFWSDTISGANPTLREQFSLGSVVPQQTVEQTNGYYVEGEALEYIRGSGYPITELSCPGSLSPVQLHDIRLLIMLQYAQEMGMSDWEKIADPFLNALFDDALASCIGSDLTRDSLGMRTAIAYSAIDEGAKVFGNTGIRAMFDDANELGKVLTADASSILQSSADTIVKLLVQFAGQLALGKVEDSKALEGVLKLSTDENTLAVDFSDSLWDLGNLNGINVISREFLKGVILEQAGWSSVNGAEPTAAIRTAMKWLWNNCTADIIDRVVFATKEGSLNTTIAGRDYNSTEVTLFAASNLNDNITGSKDRDYIYGGADADQIQGGDGDDLLAGGEGDDTLCGGDGKDFLDGGDGNDIVFYAMATQDDKVKLQLKSIKDDVAGEEITLELDGGNGNIDRVIQVEKVELTFNNDELRISQKVDKLGFNVVFDGGLEKAGADVLDFSRAASSVYIDYARENIIGDAVGVTSAPYAVEIYQDYSPILQLVQLIYSVIRPSSEPAGLGAYNGTGLRFTNFEHVIGSSQNDVMGLWQLSPGGVLTAEQRAQLDAARAGGILMGADPSAIGAFFDQRMEQAQSIPQNQVDVLIEAGAGNDIVQGTETGANCIYGGAGNDILFAGGFTSEIHGGEGDDFLAGGGFKSHLYGDGGKDTFNLTSQTFVMDADKDGDHATWGLVFPLTGGVQQWWMENGWAYWSPFTSIMAAVPGLGGAVFGNIWGAVGMLVDAACMGTVRYGISNSNQLIIQFFRGRAGQGVIENYEIETDTGKATANIAVFQQSFKPGRGSIEEFTDYLNLAMKAGFGVCFKGTDPLVLDLDGDGVELTRQEQGVYFDLDKDGFAERTAWVKGDDALLARDLNNNGKIDDIGELFGNADTSGFVHLKAMDENNDNKISALDTAFDTLRVWQDKNGNGITDEGELKTLTEVGISDISLVTSTPADGVVRGNTIRTEATFTRTDGTTSAISDVLLENNKTDSIYLGDSTVSAEAAVLPKLKGYGIVTNLDIAMTKDMVLLGKVASLKNMPSTTTWEQIRNTATDILYRWAGVDGVAAVAMGEGGFDQQKLAFLEKYFGYQMTPRDSNGNPYLNNLGELTNSWNSVLDKATLRLAAQGPLSEFFSGITYDMEIDSFLLISTTSLADLYTSVIGQLAMMPDTALDLWNNNWAPLLAELDDTIYRIDGIQVKTDYVIQSLIRAVDGLTSPLTMQELVNGLGLTGVQLGTVGADTLSRGTDLGLKVYVGGSGNDTLNGGIGQDVYVYGRNFGQDVINDSEKNESGDRVRFACYGPQDITLKRVGCDLIIGIKESTDTITVKGHFDMPLVDLSGRPIAYNRAIEEIQFADGTIYEAGDISAVVGLGTDGNDVVEGVGTIDELEGLKGDDLLMGGDNGDTYYFTKGDGNDTIQDVMTNSLLNAPDILVLLGGIRPEHMLLSRDGASDNLKISFDTGTDSIMLMDQFNYTPLGYTSKYALNNRMEAIFFDQGNGLNWLDLQAATIATYTTSGNDTTYGFGTPDHFDASAGNDMLVGFDGGDTYSFGRASGQDTIHDQSRYPDMSDGILGPLMGTYADYSWGADDTLIFDEGILPTDVTFKRTGEAPDLLISINGTTDTLTIKDQFEAVKLDLCNLFGIAWFDRIEKFKFADGTILTWEDVLKSVTTGTAESENLYGAMYDDRLDGKEGNDYLSGGDGSDTYDFGRGYGQDIIEDNRKIILVESKDTVKFGADISVSDIDFKRDGNTQDLLISIKGTTDTLRIKNQYDIVETGVFGTQEFNQIENFVWADGTAKTWATLAQELIIAAQTAGDDLIMGTHFDDTLIGGLGNDRFEGGNGADTYIFNRGNGSVVVSDFWSNILSGNGDKIVFGDNILPSDIRIDRYGAELENVKLIIAGTMDSISIEGQFLDSTINYRPYEIEAFSFENGTTWTAADLRTQYLLQQQTAGDDTITGFWTPDTYRFAAGSGNDVIVETMGLVTSDNAASDTVEFGEGITAANTILGRSGNDLVFAFSGLTDKLTIKNQFDHGAWYPSWTDVEIFKFADGTTWSDEDVRKKLVQQARTNGDDSITGFFTADVIDGGAGNDTLSGLGGGDTYIFGKGYGQDVIEENCTVYEDYPDTISFLSNVAPSEVTFLKVGDDLTISITGVSDTLTVKNHFGLNYSMVEFFKFADGSILTAAQVAAGAMHSQSTSGNDVITGTTGADLIDGGPGNDSLRGSDGNDTYHFSLGFGQDVIEETVSNPSIEDNDKVVFGAGLNSDKAILSRINEDLIVKFQETTDQITIKGQFNHAAFYSGWNDIETFSFADGVQWTDAMVRQRLITQSQTAGNDTIEGFWGDDVIDGGAGNDTLRGFGGGDTYIFGKGSGQDLIEESYKAFEDQQDTISFLSNVIGTEVQFLKVENDLKISITDTNDTLIIKNHFATAENSVELFTFADGSTLSKAEVNVRAIQAQSTIGNDIIVGTNGSDTFYDLGGDDTIRGGDGADVYNFASGFGQDVIEESVSNVGISDDDLVVFSGAGLTSDKAVLSRINDDLIVKFQGITDQITIKEQFSHGAWYPGSNDIETLSFADGVQWTDAMVRQKLIMQSQTAGNDTIEGFWGDDVIDGGVGNDTLRGFGGGDTYIFGKGSGQDLIEESYKAFEDFSDTIQFSTNVLPSEVTFFKIGNDLKITIADTSDQLTIKNHFGDTTNEVELFRFVDGTELTKEQMNMQVVIMSTDGADELSGINNINNNIYGGAGNDSLYGMNLDDILDGGAGNDTLQGGDGADTYIFDAGFGQDVIEESVSNVMISDNDIAVFGSGLTSDKAILSRSGNDLIVSFQGSTDLVTVKGQFSHSAWFSGSNDIETFQFADGVQWTDAQVREMLIQQSETVGNDTVTGYWTADTFDGGAGNDTLIGLGGGDTYLFGKGSGQDVIMESATSYEDQPDTVSFLPNVASSDVTFQRVNNDLRISIAGVNDTLTVKNQFGLSTNAVELFQFADGTSLTAAQIASNIFYSQSTSGDDLIVGTNGSDVITGGLGNDTLQGGDGADTYIFDAGFGRDVIKESVSNVSISDNDSAVFGSGLTSDKPILSRSGDDLIVGFQGSTDQVTVKGQFSHGAWYPGWNDIETFQFADGVQWTDAQVREMLIQQSETAGNDTVTGYWTADTFDGGAGNDTLSGLGGGDTYLFGIGSGQDIIMESIVTFYEDQPDTISFLPNVASSDVTFLKVGNDLKISIAGATDTLTVKNHFGSSYNAVELFKFTNGMTLTAADVTILAVAAQATNGDDMVTGTSGADTLYGGAGNDTLDGGSGSDTMFGGTGNDIYVVDNSGDRVIENPGEGSDKVQSSISYTLGADVENLTLTGSAVISGTGNALDNTIIGNSANNVLSGGLGNDTLSGGLGADTMTGGLGNDTYVVDNIGDGVTELPDEGIDIVQSTITYTLGANVENLTLLGTAVVSGTGNALDNTIIGNSANNVINGGAGNDILRGGLGNDTYIFGMGSGNDTINSDEGAAGNGVDTLQFQNLVLASIEFTRNNDDLVCTISETGENVRLTNWALGANYQVDQVQFADGTLTAAQISQRIA